MFVQLLSTKGDFTQKVVPGSASTGAWLEIEEIRVGAPDHRRIVQMQKTDRKQQRVRKALSLLGERVHTLTLRGSADGTRYYLGDYSRVKWIRLSHALPSDLQGKSILGIGGNGGFIPGKWHRGALRPLWRSIRTIPIYRKQSLLAR
jgi:hypothetical protein